MCRVGRNTLQINSTNHTIFNKLMNWECQFPDLCISHQDSRLRSAAQGNFVVHGTNLTLTTGAFSVAEPHHCNTLQTWLWQTGSSVTFCSKLKAHFFNLSYNA